MSCWAHLRVLPSVAPRESQIALTLRVVCGLTTAEISAAFLSSEPTMAQRLPRARKALRDTGREARRRSRLARHNLPHQASEGREPQSPTARTAASAYWS